MKFIGLLLLLLSFSLASISSLASTNQTTPDHFSISLQWPRRKCGSEGKGGECCLPKKGKPPLNDFIISDFQPVIASLGLVPSNCSTTTKYQPSKIADLVPSLEKNWPSLSCPSRDSKNLWREKWVESGTCSESLLNQHDYFAAALRVQKQINLLKLLADAGIKANGTYYPGEAINKAIRKAGLGDAAVTCREDEKGLTTVLDKIMLCADTKGNKHRCPGSAFWICDSRNGNAVLFPSL
ncbi:unnamed protein product [Cuscuta campestris]|uniref:Uncharacterized protein n=1 Tax=Cuscuta campestris TaxID=132261 RepID=A0A484MKT2_9ASTE|nr:unnamed protein product [Cuscuta campestris]